MTIEGDGGSTSGRRGRWRVPLVVVVLVAVAAAVPWTWGRVVDSCRAEEEASYPELERLASQTLEGIDHEQTRYSGCLDTGQPGPSVRARVSEWAERQDATAFLDRAGWILVAHPNAFLSPDDRGVAQVVTVDDGAEGTYVEVAFSMAG